MHRSTRIVLAVACAALAAPCSAAAAPALRNSVVADDLGPPLRGWQVSGHPGRRHVRFDPGEHYAIDGHGLALSPGGSIARPLPVQTSLSLDVRVPPGAAIEVRLGGGPIVLRRRRGGALRVSSGASSATLPPSSAWARGGWRHLQIAGLDPLEVHVDGVRVPHAMKPGPRLRLRTLGGTVQLTGLIATRPHDSRALLLHRLAEYHARTPDRRYPLGVSDDGRLRFREGEHDGHYAGALWRAHDLTGARLFRGWADKTTWEHADWHGLVHAPWQGARFLHSSAAAFERSCPRGTATAHRCRVLAKSTGSATGKITGMARGNPGTWAIPTVIWPNRCATCASPDEVEIRTDTMVDTGLVEFDYVRSMGEPGRPPGAREHAGRETSLRHADTVARLLVRDDGSTAEAVRLNRLDGSVIAYEHRLAPSAGSTWARGHASAIYGFARTGLAFGRADLVAVAERAAGYVESRLAGSGRMPYDLADPASPADVAAGLLAAAGLHRLAEACERMPGTCADADRWIVLARGLLATALTGVSPHAPIGTLGEMSLDTQRGEWLLGLHYALEAIERDAAR